MQCDHIRIIMAFYDLNKDERIRIVEQIHKDILNAVKSNTQDLMLACFSDEDTTSEKLLTWLQAEYFLQTNRCSGR